MGDGNGGHSISPESSSLCDRLVLVRHIDPRGQRQLDFPSPLPHPGMLPIILPLEKTAELMIWNVCLLRVKSKDGLMAFPLPVFHCPRSACGMAGPRAQGGDSKNCPRTSMVAPLFRFHPVIASNLADSLFFISGAYDNGICGLDSVQTSIDELFGHYMPPFSYSSL